MSQEKLDLFQAAAILPTELGAGAAQVVRPEPLDPDLFGALLDQCNQVVRRRTSR
jgi:hypothetical protein